MTTTSATVLTHRRGHETHPALERLIERARAANVTLRFDPDETKRHNLTPAPGIEVNAERSRDVSVCITLGGDGTIFSGLREYANTAVPVFGVNFGEVGFLATVDRDQLDEAFDRALSGDFETLELPALTFSYCGQSWVAINDVSIHRKAGLRVAQLSYGFAGHEVGRVRCDGLVIATPQGSTGYNLANGGPVLAWGVAGFVVSFIAPHSLTARPLVVAPNDRVTITNVSKEESVEVHVDGRPVCDIAAGGDIEVEFGKSHSHLAQTPGTTFYRRLRERFGRLAS